MKLESGWWFQPLWKIWKSVGIMTFPIYGKIKAMFQTTNQESNQYEGSWNWGCPQIIHFNRISHEINPLFWGTPQFLALFWLYLLHFPNRLELVAPSLRTGMHPRQSTGFRLNPHSPARPRLLAQKNQGTTESRWVFDQQNGDKLAMELAKMAITWL